MTRSSIRRALARSTRTPWWLDFGLGPRMANVALTVVFLLAAEDEHEWKVLRRGLVRLATAAEIEEER